MFEATRSLKNATLFFDGAPEMAPIPINIMRGEKNIYGNIFKNGLVKIPLGQIYAGEVFEIKIPKSASLRIYSFRIFQDT